VAGQTSAAAVEHGGGLGDREGRDHQLPGIARNGSFNGRVDHLAARLLPIAFDQRAGIQIDKLQRASRIAQVAELRAGDPGDS
jgi:hypothetical protein